MLHKMFCISTSILILEMTILFVDCTYFEINLEKQLVCYVLTEGSYSYLRSYPINIVIQH